ncbi:hypothetical protein A2715_00940 [Candidatus Woesebacteria bacterium RIFCSPHIGHO2_01_FULL_39_32]|uniref:Nucleoside 2-deoxyribosyltransferase n=2 Tax=Candidatus Woeseibacteriota TaxID=1752722 RepID=A0A0G0SXN3_9BACT|nr:MAG: hypothetical protein UT61_C0008G0013 [Candidatus Woesebacteria bacterium GW2011_GWA1_39_8]OGM05699.1 MAG: hypothetical protein A2124_04715 [Candidatus Woesebacteria bacterium GWB1_37_5]OGM24477.1 MAG: hypothetical protein A2715_00940 [Candidatus Woesebacteria bacterium RIFCSPHIGHO2_01_FULL_39_32]OGM38698.1 MAG: hypothetical protein A3F01_05970 [Candidatus Woesebacteria bacterium RIFCSPHIGHO2_12_FULL_38_11]OGM63783.1 MAG: hypothetical protein A2893_02275 [Candidatus Woesebacteria bacteri
MIIFYTASFFGKKKYQKYYDLVLSTLKGFDITLIGTEIGNYKDLLSDRVRLKLSDNPKLLHYEAIRQGIHQADAIVVEVSNEDFQVGHEAMFAISEKKPVLVLSINEDLSKRIFNDYFFGAKYTKTTIRPIIQDFLAKVRQLTLTKRFNMFLYPHQVDYLKKAAKKEGINMSEYIRKLINIDKRLSNPDNY